MYSNSGYYDSRREEAVSAETDFFVHCCGHYRLVSRECFITDRKGGTPNYQLLYVADGRTKFQIQGKMCTVSRGCCVLYRPYEPQYYEYHLSDHADVYWVHFSCDDRHPLLKQTGMDTGAVYEVGSHSDYVRLFERIILELQLKKEYFSESNTMRLQELLLLMARNRDRHSNPDFYTYYPQVEEAIRRFQQCPEANFTIKEYAKENKLNYYRFIDSFTGITGMAPRQYIISIRMSKARELLDNEAFSIADVAQLVGYENPLYFSRIFKKAVGMPPTEYRSINNHCHK